MATKSFCKKRRGRDGGCALTWRLLLAAACAAWLTPGLRAEPDPQLGIGVRSKLAEKPAGAKLGKTYAILSVQQVDSERRLLKPVNADALLARLLHELNTHGFTPVAPGLAPDILLMAQFGRGWLTNPYLGDDATFLGMSSVSVTGGSAAMERVITRDMTSSSILLDGRAPGHEANLQKASFEKLYLRVIAWEYPTNPKARARMLWKTAMVADDPDHWDLNVVAPLMLAAGAPYFGREIPEQEIEVTARVAEGHVEVGTPEVVGMVEPARAPVAVSPPPAMIISPGGSHLKKFDLPAGEAIQTLQVFIGQSGGELIYPVEQVRHIQTQAVSGKFTARAALDRMLEGSGLRADLDEKTGVFIIHQARR